MTIEKQEMNFAQMSLGPMWCEIDSSGVIVILLRSQEMKPSLPPSGKVSAAVAMGIRELGT